MSRRVHAVSSTQSDLVNAEAVVFDAFEKNDAPKTLREVTVLGHNTDQLVEVEPVAV